MKKETRISLIRHGSVDNPEAIFYGRLPGFGLDAHGIAQAKSAAGALARKRLAAVFSSPLLRARQTAREILAQHPALRLRVSGLLNEVHSDFERRTLEDLAAVHDDIYTGAAPEFEQPADVAARALRFMRRVRRQYAGKHVAAVTHGDIIVFAVLWARGFALVPENKLRLSGTGVLRGYPAPGSVTTFTYSTAERDEKPCLGYLNPVYSALSASRAGNTS